MVNIAIDCDGTLTRYPKLFEALGLAVRGAGGRVYLLTGNRAETMVERANATPEILNDADWYDAMVTWDVASEEERALVGTRGARHAVGVFKIRMAQTLGCSAIFDDDVEHVKPCGGVAVLGVMP